jgi:phosphoglycolate phosphatase
MANALTLLVDLDGTLTDNFHGISRSIRHALAALDTAAPDDESLRQCVGPPLRGTFARLLGTDDTARVESAIAHYRERYSETGWQENSVYDGIAAAIADLAARGDRLFLCTSKPQPYAEKIVSRYGFMPHLSGVYGADLAGTLDDKATLIAHLATQEGLDLRRCIMIGDRRHDVRAARANGARAVGVLWGYGSRAELEEAGAHAIVAEPGALAEALDRLGADRVAVQI